MKAGFGHELRRGPRALALRLLANAPATATVVTMLATLGYCVIVVGGNHFEFRLLGHLVPLAGIVVAAIAARAVSLRGLLLRFVCGGGLGGRRAHANRV